MRSVLFVDDDPMVLRGIERQFEDVFDVVTTDSVDEALQILEAQSDLPMVVTDMDMPAMTGIDFIERARGVAGNARFVMLTGNRDLEVASAAVNRGAVFRLLHKPCDPQTLAGAIEAGLAEWDGEKEQRELLHHTFVGAVSTLTSMLDRAGPEMLAARDRVVAIGSALRRGAGIDDHWEFCLAAKLSLLGFRALDLNVDPFIRGVDPVGENQKLFQATANKAAGLIDRIPRLATVAAMIRAFPASDGAVCHKKPRTEAARTTVGASLLRVSALAQGLLRHGVDPEAAAREVESALPGSAECLRQSIAMMEPYAADQPTKVLSVSDVKPGMVVARNVAESSGGTVLRDGKRLDERLIAKVDALFKETNTSKPIEVTHHSWLAFREVTESAFSI